MPAGFLLAFHDEYGARGVATGRIRRFVERFENARYLNADVTPGHEAALDVRRRRVVDVQRLASLLSFEPGSERYGYYVYPKKKGERGKWYMQTDAIVQRLLFEGYVWVDRHKVRDAIAMRKGRLGF